VQKSMDPNFDFNHTIDHWIAALDQYSLVRLLAKPAPGKWSIGQVYMHVISQTDYFLMQSKIAASTDDYRNEEMSPDAKSLFRRNEFPDVLLEGPPSNDHTPEPDGKEYLRNNLVRVKEEYSHASALISKSAFRGKAKHPGLGYFSAREWLQFADIHFRHHLRQKKRIDDFLKITFPD